jgi:hypothetical protein
VGARVPLWEFDAGRLPGPLGKLGKKELHLWLGAWLADRARKARTVRAYDGPRHLLFALCDHYEPLHGQATTTRTPKVVGAPMERGVERVRRWRTEYPKLARFRDADGRAPRHTFFYPGDQYDPRLVEPVAELCTEGFGEVEVHLHHEDDTRETLRASLEETLRNLDAHGLVPRKHARRAWAFIHGNWCLANARRDGRKCGVDDELRVLHELGCYADFTFPAAPDEAQPGIVNAIYYPAGDDRRRRAYERADRARVGAPRQDKVLLIEGPLALARRPGSFKVRIEGAALDASDPPSPARLDTWVNQRVVVEGRPEWVFVKVHTHGAPEKNADVILGARGEELHEALATRYNDGAKWMLHYVSAREMYNVARAAMDGKSGSPAQWFDYEVPRAERLNRERKA